jgi:hypothetical protein
MYLIVRTDDNYMSLEQASTAELKMAAVATVATNRADHFVIGQRLYERVGSLERDGETFVYIRDKTDDCVFC